VDTVVFSPDCVNVDVHVGGLEVEPRIWRKRAWWLWLTKQGLMDEIDPKLQLHLTRVDAGNIDRHDKLYISRREL
jgi:hypothetical protein